MQRKKHSGQAALPINTRTGWYELTEHELSSGRQVFDPRLDRWRPPTPEEEARFWPDRGEVEAAILAVLSESRKSRIMREN